MTQGPPQADALTLESVTKSFPGVRALRDVSLALRPGSVHGLLGENGAGKSTLIKIATGALAADDGVVRIGGEVIARPSRRAAQALGVRAIFQERQIAADLSVAENVLLDRLPRTRFGTVDWGAAARIAGQRLHTLGIDLDPRSPVRRLSVAQLQLIEIARAVSYDARVVVMDEPTASLGRHEVEPLFAVVRRLRAEGVGVLFISHHLEEVFEICDDYTVLRDGAVVGTGAISELTPADAVSKMFGRSVSATRVAPDATRALGPVTVVVDGVSTRRLDDVSIEVRAGEVVAVTGGIGAGVSEVARVIAGATRTRSGRVLLGPPSRQRSPRSRRHAVACGVALLPADRKRQGLLLDKSIADNVMLGRQGKGRSPWMPPGAVRRQGAVLASQADVRAPSASTAVRTLSGGNQQKVMIGRSLGVDAEVLVFDEPTAGIDIASKFEIYATIRRLAADGAAVVLCSTDFQEVGQVADRVIVMRAGRIVGEVPGADADEHTLIQIEMGR